VQADRSHAAAAARNGEEHGPRWLLAVECLVIALLFWLDATHHLLVSKTPWLLLLGWASLRLRGALWRDVGLKRGPGLRRLAYLGIMGGIALETFQLTITQPLVVRLLGAPPDLHQFASLEGDAGQLALYLPVVWILAAFGEELVWRGYLLNRTVGLLGRCRAPYSLALVAVSCLFGLAHADQGTPGVAIESVSGLILGATYLGCDRSLSIPIAVHGVVDTIDIVLGYLGQLPGT
jgi:membrane protease YdiL (CAAX protease family)